MEDYTELSFGLRVPRYDISGVVVWCAARPYHGKLLLVLTKLSIALQRRS